MLVSYSVIMNFTCLLKLSLGNACMLIWFWDEDFLHHIWGYLAAYWKRSLRLLHLIFYITFFLHKAQFRKKSYMFSESLDFWKSMLLWLGCSSKFCPFQNKGNIFLVSKYFCLFSLQCCFRFCCCRWVPWDFCCVWKF